jgi:tetratricopeptide (TPR) repeat protein
MIRESDGKENFPQGNKSTLQQQSSSFQDNHDAIENLKKEFLDIKNKQYQELISRAQDNIYHVNNLVQWSAVFFTAFAIIVGILSFFGFKEYRKIQEKYKEAEDLKNIFQCHLDDIMQIENKFEVKFQDLYSRFEKESKIFMEASYNYSVASIAYKDSNNLKAIEHFKKVVTLQPFNTDVLCRLGRAYTNLGELTTANEYFNKALSIEETSCKALIGLATSHRYIDLDLAIDFAQKAIKADPTNDDAFNYLGLLYRDKSHIDDAIRAHEQALKIKASPETYYFLGLLYLCKKDNENAELMIKLANRNLKNEEDQGNLRTLWSILIKCSKLIAEGNHEKALKLAAEMKSHLTTKRTYSAVVSHLRFLLDALEKGDMMSVYVESISPDESNGK